MIRSISVKIESWPSPETYQHAKEASQNSCLVTHFDNARNSTNSLYSQTSPASSTSNKTHLTHKRLHQQKQQHSHNNRHHHPPLHRLLRHSNSKPSRESLLTRRISSTSLPHRAKQTCRTATPRAYAVVVWICPMPRTGHT